MDTTSHIRVLLLDIGIPANFLGFIYIVYAVQLALDNSKYAFKMTKELYIDVATHYHTSHIAVERCIRYAIATGMEYGSAELIGEIFSNSINPKRGVPTNSQFITSLCLYIKRQQLQEPEAEQ